MIDRLPAVDNLLILDTVKSLLLLVGVLAVRAVLLRAVMKNQTVTAEGRRRWAVAIRNTLGFIFFIGFIFIWAHELRTFAVSLVAIAVALVLATKELILCVSGSVVRITSNAYSLGDVIQIGALRGKVTDQNLLATRIVEIGPGQISQQYTGRAIVFPNSLLLTTPVVSETYTNAYGMHIITVPLTATDDWQKAERVLLEAANAECSPFLEEAQRHMKQLEGKQWLDTPTVEPRVTVELPEAGRLNLLLRIPSPAQRAGRLEQAILRRFLESWKGWS